MDRVTKNIKGNHTLLYESIEKYFYVMPSITSIYKINYEMSHNG